MMTFGKTHILLRAALALGTLLLPVKAHAQTQAPEAIE